MQGAGGKGWAMRLLTMKWTVVVGVDIYIQSEVDETNQFLSSKNFRPVKQILGGY